MDFPARRLLSWHKWNIAPKEFLSFPPSRELRIFWYNCIGRREDLYLGGLWTFLIATDCDNAKDLVAVVLTGHSSSANCSYNSCHVRALLESGKWSGSWRVQTAQESAGIVQNRGKQRNRNLSVCSDKGAVHDNRIGSSHRQSEDRSWRDSLEALVQRHKWLPWLKMSLSSAESQFLSNLQGGNREACPLIPCACLTEGLN